MKQAIQRVAIIGLGAVGTNFAYYLNRHLPKGALRIVGDAKRIHRYQAEGVYYNGERCDFTYVIDSDKQAPVDLVIFCTKSLGLEAACVSMKHHIDEHTLLMSAVNGITSEQVLEQYFPKQNVIYTVAQGMDATKEDLHVTCSNIGELVFGAVYEGQDEAVDRIHHFFSKLGFPHRVKEDIIHHQWGKFMLNCGLNQVAAVYHGTYGTIQTEGAARTQMLEAMREVQRLSVCEGINLKEADVMRWAAMCDPLDPQGMPSMAQDVKAKRPTEVDLFAKEVCKRAARYHLSTPVNAQLYRQLKEIENHY